MMPELKSLSVGVGAHARWKGAREPQGPAAASETAATDLGSCSGLTTQLQQQQA